MGIFPKEMNDPISAPQIRHVFIIQTHLFPDRPRFRRADGKREIFPCRHPGNASVVSLQLL
jgi:hypothetical protein